MSVLLKADISLIPTITSKQAWRYRVVPAYKNELGGLILYTDNSNYPNELLQELSIIFGGSLELENIDQLIFEQLLIQSYGQRELDNRQQVSYYHGDSELFLDHLITEARRLKSSDIHIEIFEGECRVRIRIDGVLIQRYLLEKKQYPSLINKIKIIGNLDIAEKRLPQDGRIFYSKQSLKIDIRVSILPTLYGEKIVLRLLGNDSSEVDIHELGFRQQDLVNYLEAIKRPNGLVLISGPTGSGKTTTLYATLKILNKTTRNIITIEDPIEYTLPGVNQVQVKEAIGFDFATALRTFLRQDPDIIMVGEIRDVNTANIALRAALTGHLVLSTIHTNSAWGIISRLLDMGIPPYLVANTLNLAVAQRLVRTLCPKCKKRIEFKKDIFPSAFIPSYKIDYHYDAVGCDDCFNTGYKGRKAIYEVVNIDNQFAEEIKKRNDLIYPIFKEKGLKSLSENAFDLFSDGMTSIDEIYSLLMN